MTKKQVEAEKARQLEKHKQSQAARKTLITERIALAALQPKKKNILDSSSDEEVYNGEAAPANGRPYTALSGARAESPAKSSVTAFPHALGVDNTTPEHSKEAREEVVIVEEEEEAGETGNRSSRAVGNVNRTHSTGTKEGNLLLSTGTLPSVNTTGTGPRTSASTGSTSTTTGTSTSLQSTPADRTGVLAITPSSSSSSSSSSGMAIDLSGQRKADNEGVVYSGRQMGTPTAAPFSSSGAIRMQHTSQEAIKAANMLPPLPPLPTISMPERIWTKCSKEASPDDIEANPFGAPLPEKSRMVVLHPDLFLFLKNNSAHLAAGIKNLLDPGQVALLLSDFDSALERWDPIAYCDRTEKWKAIEASRYADFNPVHGRVDVNVAVKLLVPIEAEENWKQHSQYCVGVKPAEKAGEGWKNLRFSLLEPSVASSSSSRFQTPERRGDYEERRDADPVDGQGKGAKAQSQPLLHPMPGSPAVPIAIKAVRPSFAEPKDPAPAKAQSELASSITAKPKKHPSPPLQDSISWEDEADIVQPDWPQSKMDALKARVLEQHLRSRTAHRPVKKGDKGYFEHMYSIWIRHVDTAGPDGRKGEAPPNFKQKWALLDSIVESCGTCAKLRREKVQQREEAERAAERAAQADLQREKDWEQRLNHRLENDEYETDSDHIADNTCSVCKQKAGRRGRKGSRFGDADDKDDLLNCDGCSRAFHHDCHPNLVQDTPENRRRHGLRADRPLTFARRREPHLCPECWRTAGHRQLDYDTQRLNERMARFHQELALHKDKRARANDDGSVNSNLYLDRAALPAPDPLQREHSCLGSPGYASDTAPEEEMTEWEFKQLLQGDAILNRTPVQKTDMNSSFVSSILPSEVNIFEPSPSRIIQREAPRRALTPEAKTIPAPVLVPVLVPTSNRVLPQKSSQNFEPIASLSSDEIASAEEAQLTGIMDAVRCTRQEAADALIQARKIAKTATSAVIQAATTILENRNRSPVERAHSLYQGEFTPGESPSSEQLTYGLTRKFISDLICREIGIDNGGNISCEINIELEKSSNFESAMISFSEKKNTSVSLLREHLCVHLDCFNDEALQIFFKECQIGFLKSRKESRQQVEDFISTNVQCSRSVAINLFNQEFKLHGNSMKAVESVIEQVELAAAEQEDEQGDEGLNEASRSLIVQAISDVTGADKELVTSTLTSQIARYRDLNEAVKATTELIAPNGKTAIESRSGVSDEKPVADIVNRLSATEIPMDFSRTFNQDSHRGPDQTLKDAYALTLLNESQSSGKQNGLVVQLERPYQWEDTSPDPKYPCAGYKASSYLFWKNHCQKRRAQGAPQKYIVFISFAIVKMIVSTLRIVPESDILKMSDEDLIHRLDVKFQIAQESNLLTKKFSPPERPKKLASYELHIPHEEFHTYATEWLKEKTINQERHKDLDKYDLSDVFIQSLQDCPLLYGHARVLTKLSVEDLIASCSDFLQLQVMNEAKTSALRKQLDISPPIPKPSHLENGDLTRSKGVLSLKQARALITEASKMASGRMQGGISKHAIPATNPPTNMVGLVPFFKSESTTIVCEGCGKWYQSFPDKKFPYPCSGGRCQYIGHPSMNKNYQNGTKWKYPGYCCSWKGIPDKDIPQDVLNRLRKYALLRTGSSLPL